MNNEIKKILEEIYMVDDELKNHEMDLEKIILELIKHKPEIEIDQVFVKKLREKIMTEELISGKKEVEKSSFFSLSNLVFTGAGAVVMLLIMLPFLTTKTQPSEGIANNSKSVINQMVALGDRAFGSLTGAGGNEGSKDTTAATESASALAPSVSSRTFGLGGGGGVSTSDVASIGVDAKMIAPYYPNYGYKYVGDDLALTAGEEKVYRKIASSGFDLSTGAMVGALNLGVIDISKFNNLSTQNISFIEDKDFGLGLFVNPIDGSIDINQNWERWKRPDASCQDDACFNSFRLKMSDVPSDEAILAVAKQFISDYGIDTKNYGEPMIQNNWKDEYNKTEDKTNYYIPEDIQVIYPLLVENEMVYDQGGNPSGMSVNVNIRFNKVSNLSSLRSDSYESSNYAVETDQARIIKLAENGGVNQVYYMQEDGTDVKIETIELGTPSKILLRYWSYDNTKQTSSELFIPALNFPITKVPDKIQYFYQKSVVIPLVKEILDTYEDNASLPRPEPLPYIRGMEGDAIEPMMLDSGATTMTGEATSAPVK